MPAPLLCNKLTEGKCGVQREAKLNLHFDMSGIWIRDTCNSFVRNCFCYFAANIWRISLNHQTPCNATVCTTTCV